MVRQIIEIDKDKCNGCGLCAEACHESAIAIIEGKAELIRDDYCDGMGDCLPNCPQGAISFVQREAAEYDREAVEANIKKKTEGSVKASGCPGTQMRVLKAMPEVPAAAVHQESVSALSNWPPQIKLAPIKAPYYAGAKLLIAADCTAFAYAGIHEDFISGRVTLFGCPKLDGVDYSEKLTEIIRNNDIKSVCILRMQVPCCGGLAAAVQKALMSSGKFIPWQVVTLSLDGKIIDQ